MTARILVMMFAIASLTVGAHAEIYRWIDEAGHVHYSDNPPDKSKTSKIKIHVQSITAPAIVTTVDSPLRSAPAANAKGRIKLYTAAWCGYCKRAKAYLTGRGIGYEEMDVETSDRGRRDFAALGGHGVPVILVGSQRMDGYDQASLAALLQAEGY